MEVTDKTATIKEEVVIFLLFLLFSDVVYIVSMLIGFLLREWVLPETITDIFVALLTLIYPILANLYVAIQKTFSRVLEGLWYVTIMIFVFRALEFDYDPLVYMTLALWCFITFKVYIWLGEAMIPKVEHVECET